MTRWCYRSRVLAMVLVAALGGSACQSESEAPDPEAAAPAEEPTDGPAASSSAPTATPSATPALSPASTADPAEAEVLAAYQAYWDTYVAANQSPPTADYPDLARYATGEALRTVTESTSRFRAAGQVFRSPPDSIVEHRTSVLEITGDTAKVRDCYIDDGWTETLATGERQGEGVGTRLIVADMVREDGSWKVAYPANQRDWEGVAGCAVE